MADDVVKYEWLSDEHPEYAARKAGWERDERRAMGGDDVLEELAPFDYEEKGDAHYKLRLSEAVYINLPRQHASTVTGHLRKSGANSVTFGSLGDVRPRDEIAGEVTRAELAWYNIDGIGNDGSGYEAWWDTIDELAQVTGHIWVGVEASESAPISFQDELNGLRPFGVYYSPLEVPNWHYVNGKLMWIVIKAATEQPRLEGDKLVRAEGDSAGYYLMVAAGWKGFGPTFEGGGWWLFNADKELIEGRTGQFVNTNGEIPFFRHYGRKAKGTTKKPVSSASDTMELGQLAIEMMNTRSARKFDFWDACGSKLFVLGATEDVMTTVVETYKKSQLVSVPQAQDEETGTKWTPQIYDGSTGTVAADVADKLEESQWKTARRLSIEKVTTPGESGISKEAGFAEASAPDLARRAMLREESENTFLHFLCLRWGVAPDASSRWSQEIDLAPLVDEIDAMFATLELSGAESDTLTIELVMSALEERGVIADAATLKKIRGELEAKMAAKAAQKEADRQAFLNPPTTPPSSRTIDISKTPEGGFRANVGNGAAA